VLRFSSQSDWGKGSACSGELLSEVVAAEVKNEGLLARTGKGGCPQQVEQGAPKLPLAERWCDFPCSILEKAAEKLEWGFASLEVNGEQVQGVNDASKAEGNFIILGFSRL